MSSRFAITILLLLFTPGTLLSRRLLPYEPAVVDCHGKLMQLRSGNTKSGVGAAGLILSAFRPWAKSDRKYLSADSAYCNQEVIRTCLANKIHFTLTANDATTGWRSEIGSIENWRPWQYTAAQIEKAQASKRTLPKVEVGSMLWTPGWAENIRFVIVVKRTWKASVQGDLFDEGWDYYGVVAGMPFQTFSLQQVIDHHNKRGNAENFIREEKYGYDLKHFPCQKLSANHAFGLLLRQGWQLPLHPAPAWASG